MDHQHAEHRHLGQAKHEPHRGSHSFVSEGICESIPIEKEMCGEMKRRGVRRLLKRIDFGRRLSGVERQPYRILRTVATVGESDFYCVTWDPSRTM